MTDFSVQRLNMVDSQVRPSDVTDQRIVRAMLEVPRELFVPAEVAQLAYIDDPVPVTLRSKGAQARFLLPPRTLAKLVQLLEIGPQSAVLDVGCATGYSTAVLAHLAQAVTAVEAEPELAAAARETLQALGLDNAAVVHGEHARGAPNAGPFDVILLNGSVPEVPESLLAQLKDGGRLAAVVANGPQGRPHQGKACLFVKVDGEANGLPHFDANAKPLPGFSFSPAFTF